MFHYFFTILFIIIMKFDQRVGVILAGADGTGLFVLVLGVWMAWGAEEVGACSVNECNVGF